MDDLERQMEHLRDQMQRTLGGAEGAGRRTALERLRSSLSGLPGLSAARNTGASGKDAPGSAEPRHVTPTPAEAGGEAQEATEAPEEEPRRGFSSRLFGG